MDKQTHSFQAEVKQLLHLMIHSLYSNKEIFLRELVSNASDAADKLRFEALANPELLEGGAELKIRVSFDKEARTVTIDDNGIGMSREEAIAHLGTIAKSGTREFLAKLDWRPEEGRPADRPVRRGLLLGLHRRRQHHRRIAPRRPARRRGRALELRRRPATSRSRPSPSPAAAPTSSCTCARARTSSSRPGA